jgi:subtilisin family serine protease
LRSRRSQACVIALVLGLAGLVTATRPMPAGASTPDHSSTKAGYSKSGKQRSAPVWITLVTGDRVLLDAEGKPISYQPGKGRERIPVRKQIQAGHVYVTPVDAIRLIQQRRVDPRLFDMSLLSRKEYRESRARGLHYIVTYKGSSSTAKARLHSATGVGITHTYRALNAEAITVPETGAGGIWKALTNEQQNGAHAVAEPGLEAVWLDGIRRATAADVEWDRTQIGAPAAWDAGYDGNGVTVAVLDTGVDASHPDLAGVVTAAKNFSPSDNLADHVGHGTHVASTIAGSGRKSSGKYRGVAPGTKIISGKVLDDDGNGQESDIIAGMEWAARSGAKIANLSLGGTDTPGADATETAVNALSAATGVLFVIAAGNEGPDAASVGTPGSADAALTVGAVDRNSTLADFSSRGPRVGDGAIKPDVTAPGVDITAAAVPGSLIDQQYGQSPPGYTTISGTSMATPHVAAAAAILAQEHPDWNGQRIKAALMASAVDNGYTPYEQGAGQVNLAKAIKQTVMAAPGSTSLSFKTAPWPHQDDTKQSKTLSYANAGANPVTLSLTVKGRDPKGGAAPNGFFRLASATMTVPAHSTAHVDVIVDTTLGGDINGVYTAYVIAVTPDGQTVRTAATVDREVESYDVTIKHLDRAGRAPSLYRTTLVALFGEHAGADYSSEATSGTVTLRVPRGGYIMDSVILTGKNTDFDWLKRPNLSVTANTTVTVDARVARPVNITAPNAGAAARHATADIVVKTSDTTYWDSFLLSSFKDIRIAHLGPATKSNIKLNETYRGTWAQGNGSTEYHLAYLASNTRFSNGYTKHAKNSDLAKVNVTLGSSAKNRVGALFSISDFGLPVDLWARGYEHGIPYKMTVLINADRAVKWSFSAYQFAGVDGGGPEAEVVYDTESTHFTPGRTYKKTFNVGVIGPKIGGKYGIHRIGNDIFLNIPLLADSDGHVGDSSYDKAETTLYSNGKKIGSSNTSQPDAPFTAPAAKARYRLTTRLTRSGVASVSTKVSAEWTFSSEKTSRKVDLPISAVKFNPPLNAASASKASALVAVPVVILGPAAGPNLKTLVVSVSFDNGKHWKALKVEKGRVTVRNPASGSSVSFKSVVVDKKGNTLSQVIDNAYRTK